MQPVESWVWRPACCPAVPDHLPACPHLPGCSPPSPIAGRQESSMLQHWRPLCARGGLGTLFLSQPYKINVALNVLADEKTDVQIQ